MRNTKHTKGEWKYTKATYSSYVQFNIETIDQSHPNSFIGECGGGNQSDLEIEANAKLIAAAPDLLAALQRFISFVDAQKLDYESALVKQAKEAIKKAIE